MPKYRVMRYANGVWDAQEPRIVEAATARDAAEQIIGAGLVEGVDRKATVHVKVWALLPDVQWFSRPTTPL
jgi:hypothetical protein